MSDFSSWFYALWKRDPFPWQKMLAERVSNGAWPAALDLPTASGKTACIDIAIFALAVQAHHPPAQRTAPRRIWFVVDRRIVVDEAFARATEIAGKLAAATAGPLKGVGDRLRELSGTHRPLAVGRLRGGILVDDGWARIPSQPAVITSTVDQLGSRLLFRGYGHSLSSAPIFAGLAANDSLVILDEAHCAVPFMQTLQAIEKYRGPNWAEEPIASPFTVVIMSATPPKGIAQHALFPGAQRDQALDHPQLRRRLQTSKLAELVEVDDARVGTEDPLVDKAADRARQFLQHGRRRVAVMVNRVHTAHSIAGHLEELVGEGPEAGADIILLTGRIRPFERDALIEHWSRYLRAGDPEEPERPVVTVATQCLEVGADFSFDALITECASLDALRQRFGRLARLGSEERVPAVVLVRKADLEAKEPDPVYGRALAETWKWLRDVAEGSKYVDMGANSLEARLSGLEDVAPLLAPSGDAPVLLPAHLDLLCQTAPPAYPEPDIGPYLHGQRSAREVSVVWRCDLQEGDWSRWVEIVALCPPVSGEMLPVRLWLLRAWLARQTLEDNSPDVEGSGDERENGVGRIRPCLLWRGRDRSRVITHADDISPDDVVVVPASYGIEGLGQATRTKALGIEGLDLWEVARMAAGQPPAVRINPVVLAPWRGHPLIEDLLKIANLDTFERDEIAEAIQTLLRYPFTGEETPPPAPGWWLDVLRAALTGKMVEHPAGGVILFARASKPTAEPDLFADDDDLASSADREVLLDEHCRLVRRTAQTITRNCLPGNLGEAVGIAALWHDAGKLDPRFQLLLHQGDEIAAAGSAAPIAKSSSVPSSPSRRRAIREASGLPEGFRHEMLSVELADRFATLSEDGSLRDLVLHLIASHHGHARPFAPVVSDESPPEIAGRFAGVEIRLDRPTRRSIPPAHRLDSAIPERFWRLNRRFGWWGLAYLEAFLRLADWYASNFIEREIG